MVLNLQSTRAFDFDDGAVDRHCRLFGLEIHIAPTDGHRLADPGASGQHDVNHVQDVLLVQTVGAPGVLLPRVHVLAQGDNFLECQGSYFLGDDGYLGDVP